MKGNRQGFLSRSITRRSDQNRKIKCSFLFCDFAGSVSINPRPCHSEPVTDVTGVGIRNLLAGNLRKSAGIMRFGNGLPRQCVPQGHLLRGAHWLAMTGFFDSLRQPSGFPFPFNQPPQRSSSETELLRFFQLPALCCKKPDHRPSSSAR